jgi:hypothetical protein
MVWILRSTGGLALLMLTVAGMVVLAAAQSPRLTVKQPTFVLVGSLLLLAAVANGVLARTPRTGSARRAARLALARIALGVVLVAVGALMVARAL